MLQLLKASYVAGSCDGFEPCRPHPGCGDPSGELLSGQHGQGTPCHRQANTGTAASGAQGFWEEALKAVSCQPHVTQVQKCLRPYV